MGNQTVHKKGKSVRINTSNVEILSNRSQSKSSGGGGGLIIRSDQIKRIYNNGAQKSSMKPTQPNLISPGQVIQVRKNNPSVSSAYTKNLNNSAITESNIVTFETSKNQSQYGSLASNPQ